MVSQAQAVAVGISLHPGEHSLDSLPIPQEYRQALKLLGYVSLEQFISASRVAGPLLANYLKADVNEVLSRLPANAGGTPIPESALGTISQANYSFGFAIDAHPQAPAAAAIFNAAPEDESGKTPQTIVNLIQEMPPVRDQGQRGTCVAHAAVAMFEHVLRKQHDRSELYINDLSEQFLYWNCKQKDGYPNSPGTWLQWATYCLQNDGVCLDTTWGYNPFPVINNEGQGPPSANAIIEAAGFKLGTKALNPKSALDIKNELASGSAVAFCIPVFDSWVNSMQVRLTGDITLPIPNEIRSGGHAMCIVGYVDLPANPELGGGRFLIRNSWDHYWAVQSRLGSGYGTIPYSYIQLYGTEAYCVA